jgi:hypothetical protein
MVSDSIPYSAAATATTLKKNQTTKKNKVKINNNATDKEDDDRDHDEDEDNLDDNASSASAANQSNNEKIALLAARRLSADAALLRSKQQQDFTNTHNSFSSSSRQNNHNDLSPEQETHQLCEKVLAVLTTHRKATLRTIAAARAYDVAWSGLVPAIRRFEVSLPLSDIHSQEGRMTISEHISRCVFAMRCLALWQASAVQLVEAILVWRSGLNRPFPFALDGHCNLLLRVALDAAAVKSSPIPRALLIGGAGVDLDQVVVPVLFSHLPSLCEYAFLSSSPQQQQQHQLQDDSLLSPSSLLSSSTPQQLFGFGRNTHNNNFQSEGETLLDSQNPSSSSLADEDALVRSLSRRWERRAIGMHFASHQDAVSWALEAAEDVVASFAALPGRRGQQQEAYLKRVRATEFTLSLEHNTHWQLMRELLTLCAEGKHVPLLNLPGIVFPRGGEEGISVECPHLLENLLRTLVAAIEGLSSVTDGSSSANNNANAENEGGGENGNDNNNNNDEENYYEEENAVQDSSGRRGSREHRHSITNVNNNNTTARSSDSSENAVSSARNTQQEKKENEEEDFSDEEDSSQPQNNSKSSKETTGGYGYGGFIL